MRNFRPFLWLHNHSVLTFYHNLVFTVLQDIALYEKQKFSYHCSSRRSLWECYSILGALSFWKPLLDCENYPAKIGDIKNLVSKVSDVFSKRL